MGQHLQIFDLLLLSYAGPPRGNLQGIDHDCNDIPDAAMTLAVAALFAEGPTCIRNVYNWRVKVRHSVKLLTLLERPAGRECCPACAMQRYDHGTVACTLKCMTMFRMSRVSLSPAQQLLCQLPAQLAYNMPPASVIECTEHTLPKSRCERTAVVAQQLKMHSYPI